MNGQYPRHQTPTGKAYLFMLLLVVAVTGRTESSSAADTQHQAMSTHVHEAMDMAPSQSQAAVADGHEHEHQEPTYACPMHPEEVSDNPDAAASAGMFLVAAEAGAGEISMEADIELSSETAAQVMDDTPMEHARKHLDPTYACPDAPPEVSDQPGRCSICGMFLVESGAGEVKGSMGADKMLPSETAEQAMDDAPMEHARKHLDPTYVCPMHPQIVRDEPASCPICGMDLVAKREFETQDSTSPAVTLSPAVVQNMGVRTARSEKGTLRKYIRTQGKVAYDDDRIIQIHPRTAGWIENLYVRTDGVRVERKDDLADYFSPDVLWAQQDYIAALEDCELDSFGGHSEAESAARAFRERSGIDLLSYLKVPGMDIMGLERSMEPKSIIPITRAPGRCPHRAQCARGDVRHPGWTTCSPSST